MLGKDEFLDEWRNARVAARRLCSAKLQKSFGKNALDGYQLQMLPSISIILHIILRYRFIFFGDAVEPRYNEGPSDWQNTYAKTKFHYIQVLFFFFYNWNKENCSLFREPCSIEFRYIEIPL